MRFERGGFESLKFLAVKKSFVWRQDAFGLSTRQTEFLGSRYLVSQSFDLLDDLGQDFATAKPIPKRLRDQLVHFRTVGNLLLVYRQTPNLVHAVDEIVNGQSEGDYFLQLHAPHRIVVVTLPVFFIRRRPAVVPIHRFMDILE